MALWTPRFSPAHPSCFLTPACDRVASCCVSHQPCGRVFQQPWVAVWWEERGMRNPVRGTPSWLRFQGAGAITQPLFASVFSPVQRRGYSLLTLVGSLLGACDRTPTPMAEVTDAKQVQERKEEKGWASFRLSWIQVFKGTPSLPPCPPPPPHRFFSCNLARDLLLQRDCFHKPQGCRTQTPSVHLPGVPSPLQYTEPSEGSGWPGPDRAVPRPHHCAREWGVRRGLAWVTGYGIGDAHWNHTARPQRADPGAAGSGAPTGNGKGSVRHVSSRSCCKARVLCTREPALRSLPTVTRSLWTPVISAA